MTPPRPSVPLEKVVISMTNSISEALRQLDAAGTGALVICDQAGKFSALLTDGDIRRALLRGVSFEQPCVSIATLEPVIVPPGQNSLEMLALMNEHDVNHLPIIDDDRTIVGFLTRSDLTDEPARASAVIMAGGYGTRLLPITRDTPKTMLHVGDRPIMERTIARLRKAGIRRVGVSVHHLASQITSYFKDGSEFGVEMTYMTEEHPLGTAGGLKLLPHTREPIVVINGDIVTSVDFQGMLAYHKQHHADITVGVRRYQVPIPYGVIESEGPFVRKVTEKPNWQCLVNAGVYVIDPCALRFIPDHSRFDMTDLIERLIHDGRAVVSFPIVEYWKDIGQHADYSQAQDDFVNGRGVA